MSIKAEQTLNEIKYAGGYYSDKPINTTGAMSVGTLSYRYPVISGSGSTVTLTAAQSGSMVLFDRAAGIVFTLPAPVAGLNFTFFVTTSITSNAAKVITDSASTFLAGTLTTIKTDLTSLINIADGTTIRAYSANGTTTGGLLGTTLYFYCVNSTQWIVDGNNLASGTIATPFATS